MTSPLAWRTTPLLALAVAFGSGLALAPHLPYVVWWSVGAGALLLAVLAATLRHRKIVSAAPLAWTAALLLATLAVGGARYALWHRLPADDVAFVAEKLAYEEVWLEARVADEPSASEHRVRVPVAIDRLAVRGDTAALSGHALLTVPRPSPVEAELRPGAVVRGWARLEPLPHQRNPADFDYGAYLRRQGMTAVLAAEHPEDVAVAGSAASLYQRVVAAMRGYVRRTLTDHVPSDAGQGVLTALILGERHRIAPDVRERFKRTGLAHLLAVSGLHVMLVALVLYGLLQPVLLRLGLRWKTMEASRSAVTLLVLLAYVVVSGASASVVRAAVMTTLVLGAVVLQRRAHPLNSLGAAALVLLAWRPAELFGAGFQLSFAAVTALVLLMPVLERLLPASWQRGGARRWLVGLVTTSVAATLGTAPVLLYHFGQVALAGLVLNVMAIPLTLLTLSAGLLTLLLPPLAGPMGAAADVLARMLLEVAAWGDGVLGWTLVERYVTAPAALGVLVLLLLALAHVFVPARRWKLVGAACSLGAVAVWMVVPVAQPDQLEVLFFDVGQGDAALLTLPGGRTLLVDAGPRSAYADAGTRTLLPHLRRYDLDRIDDVVITHADADHLGGLPALLRGVEVGRVIMNEAPHDSELWRETQHLLDSLRIPTAAPVPGDVLLTDMDALVQVLGPVPEIDPATDPNEGSIVLRIRHGDARLLLTGDIEHAAEAALVVRYDTLLRSDLVKVPHHGSRTSSTGVFVQHVVTGQTEAVVSVARVNRFGLPDEEVLRRWQDAGAEVVLTSEGGAVRYVSHGERFERVPWQ